MKGSSIRGWMWASVFCVVVVAIAVGFRSYLSDPLRGLPYHDSFSKGMSSEWDAFGGTWELHDGTMRNDSDERGAKLTTGSIHWKDYSISADVMLPSINGDAGLILRTTDEEQGVDSYSGYYAGVRGVDNSLILGRAGHGWVESTLVLKRATVQPSVWYHLMLMAVGCQLVAKLNLPANAGTAIVSTVDSGCIQTGRAGLRSYAAGGTWRNVSILPASQSDMHRLLEDAKPTSTTISQGVVREDREGITFSAPHFRVEPNTFHSSFHTQPIAGLRLRYMSEEAATTIRGTVINPSPTLFVQDNTGGISVPEPIFSPTLKIGDQVEVTGDARISDFSSALDRAVVRVLWGGTPIPPVTITASQAATGAYDSTFIEVEGRLERKMVEGDNTAVLVLNSGSQSFEAILGQGKGGSLFDQLKPNSLLRLRGVCVTDGTYTHSLYPFALLLRSRSDIDVLVGPPWWSAQHLVAICICLLAVGLIVNFFYNRIERWRLHTVLEERERLAHEMHDTLAQSFAGIGFQIEAIRNGIPDELPNAHQQLNLASQLVRHSHEEARRSIATLRSEPYESGDLLTALETCARNLVAGGCVEVVASSTGDTTSVPLRITDTLYRIGQEAIANAVQHAHPTKLEVSIEQTKSELHLKVADDGVGFVLKPTSSGFGLRGMRKRATSISAVFNIVTNEGQGTTIYAVAPLPPRLQLATWPKFLLSHLRKRESHARTDPNPYR
jgi:hypothetical protein